MDINDNQQINTFTKGMNTDTSDMLLSTELYRYAENVRLVTNTNSDTGELRIIDGNVTLTDLQHRKLLYLNSIQNYVVAITESNWTENNISSTKFEIRVSDDYGKNNTWKTVFGPCNELLHEEGKQANISGVLRWETDKDVKFYFVDDTGKHGIMYLNIASKEVLPESYMKDIRSLTRYESQFIEAPKIEISDKIGELLPARVQYAYRLYHLGGAATNISPFSRLLSLYKNRTEGYNTQDITSRAVDITINNIDKVLLDRIQLYRITYNENGNFPIINCIYDGDVYDSTFTYTDYGYDKYLISSEEFLSLNTLRISPKVIESKENYMYAANIHDEQDDIDELFKDIDTVSWTSGMTNENNVYYHKLFEDLYKGNTEYNEQYWYKPGTTIKGGTGDIVDWRLVKKDTTFTPEYGKDIKQQISSFKHGEVYRFGIIFYDNKGRKTSPKWVADIMIPNHVAEDFYYDYGIKNETSEYVSVPHIKVTLSYYTIEFSIHTDKLPKSCVAYEIVRCKRDINDTISISQGIIGKPFLEFTQDEESNHNNVSTEHLYNPGIFTIQTMRYEDESNDSVLNPGRKYRYLSCPDVLMFASPECVYQPDDMENIFDTYKEKIQIRYLDTYHSLIKKSDVPIFPNGNPVHGGLSIIKSEGSNKRYPFKYKLEEKDQDGKIVYRFDCSGEYDALLFIYMFPYIKYADHRFDKLNNISSISRAKSPQWDNFEQNEDLGFRNDTVAVGSKYTFTNWSVLISDEIPSLYNLLKKSSNVQNAYPMSAGGDVFLFGFDKKVLTNFNNNYGIYTGSYFDIAPVVLVDIIKASVPYGGYNKYAINNSTFYSYGDINKTSQPSIEIKSGDAYPNIFTYVASHQWYGPNTWENVPKMSSIYVFPVESSIDILAQSGYLFDSTNPNGNFIQYNPAYISKFNFVQEKPAYVYNTAYGCQPTLVALGINEIKDIYSPNFNTRIHYSEPKTNGEDIDNWLAYKPINYIDVDSRHGDITELRLFKEHLMFWQPDSTGIISSNERSIVQDTSGTDLVLGSGTVAQRYDYISTKYGMKYGQFNDTLSNTSLYWWDGNEKEILQYTSGSQVIPLSTTKNIKNYINENKEVDRPNLFYNNKYKELVSYVVNNESVVYNEQVDAFTSIYKFEPKFNTSLVDYELISAGNTLELMDKNNDKNDVKLFNNPVYPLIQYVVNKNSTFVKTFDILTFGGRFYGGDEFKDIKFEYNTPLKQHSSANGEDIVTTREYDFRLNIPRAEDENGNSAAYGDRMRGKTMQCEMSSISNSKDFSLQYITTKYRISWS